LWCPECQTAIAQADVEKKELKSVFYDIEFNLEDNKPLVISTTRPELLSSCVAVFVNNLDDRYIDLI
jgi:valyl-tRNA synthetase